jgi:hypothetical protein
MPRIEPPARSPEAITAALRQAMVELIAAVGIGKAEFATLWTIDDLARKEKENET